VPTVPSAPDDDDLDPRTAALEVQLDRLDDAAIAGRTAADRSEPPDLGTFDAASDGYGFHVDDDPEAAIDPLEDAVEPHDGPDAVDAVDELVAAFNARDLEDLLAVVATDGEAPGLLGYDRANLPEAVADLWDRRPTVHVTRGELDGRVAGVLWEHDGTSWWRLAVVSVDDVSDGCVGVLEFVDDPDLVERVVTEEPEGELVEGARWQEWEEGSG
jgi:hypothetical protein